MPLKPYYEHAGITIYLGDCREVLKCLPVAFCASCSVELADESILAIHLAGGHQVGPYCDLVVTDPPYGMEFQSNYRIMKHAEIVGDSCFDVETANRLIELAGNAAYIFCRWDNLSELPKPKSVLAWVKNNWSMGDLEHEHGRQWEAIAFYPKENHKFVKRISDVIFGDRTGNPFHPTQKPTSVLKEIIASNHGNRILDAYCGGGSTLTAAKDLGREAIGIEICEEYCEIAAKRLSQEVFDFK